MPSELLAFKTMFGFPIQTLFPAKICSGSISIAGFFSSRAHVTRMHQYIYINSLWIAPNQLYKVVNLVFSKSKFGKDSVEPFPVRSSLLVSSSAIELSRISKRTADKFPAFVLHLTLPRTAYDFCMDPSKSNIEFPDWTHVLSLIQDLCMSWLKSRNLLDKQIELIRDPNDDKGLSSRFQKTLPRDLVPISSLPVEHYLHIKTSNSRFNMELEIRPDSSSRTLPTPPQPSSPSTVPIPRQDSEAYKKVLKNAKRSFFYVDKRTGNTYDTLPRQRENWENKTNQKVRMSIRRSGGISIRQSDSKKLWVKSILEVRIPPIHFTPYPTRPPRLTHSKLVEIQRHCLTESAKTIAKHFVVIHEPYFNHAQPYVHLHTNPRLYNLEASPKAN